MTYIPTPSWGFVQLTSDDFLFPDKEWIHTPWGFVWL